MGLAEMSKVDTYPPKFSSGGSTGANYSSPSTPPKRMLMHTDILVIAHQCSHVIATQHRQLSSTVANW